MIIGWLKRRKERERQEKEERRRRAKREAKAMEKQRKELEEFAKPGDRFVCAGVTYVCRRIGVTYCIPLYGCRVIPDGYKIEAVYNKKGELHIENFHYDDLKMLKAENKR